MWIFVIYEKSNQQIWEKLIGYCNKNRARCCKNYFQNSIYKTAEAAEESIGSKIAKKIMKPKLAPDENSRVDQEIVILPEKKVE